MISFDGMIQAIKEWVISKTPTKTSELTNDSGFPVSSDVLDTYEEIMANTQSGKFAGALGVKDGLEQINDSLTNENAETFNFGVKDGVRGFYTSPSKADDSFVPFNSGLTAVEHIITSGSTSAWTEFELEDTPKVIYAYRNTGTTTRYTYFFADVENESIMFYGNTSSSGASLSFSTDFESLKSENGVGKDTGYIRIYDGKIGIKVTGSGAYLPSPANPLNLVYLY